MAFARRIVTVLVAAGVSVVGCAGGGSTATMPPSHQTASPSFDIRVVSPSPSGGAEVRIADLPIVGDEVGRAPIGFALITPNVAIAQHWQPARLALYDRTTFELLHDVGFDSVPGQMPPDGQSVALGKDGVWITLAAQHAVALVDAATGTIVRRIDVDGAPYNVAEAGSDLWIADFEGGQVIRVDLPSGRTLATIPVRDPTGIAVGEGAVWATVHVGRHDEAESIDGHGGQLARIDPETNEVRLIDVGPRPYWVVTGFGSAWTGSATGGAVYRADAVTEAVTRIPVGADGAFDIERVGGSIWVGVGPQHWSPDCDPTASAPTGAVVRIDPSSNTVDGRIDIPCASGIVPDGSKLWISPVSDGDDSVLIDPGR